MLMRLSGGYTVIEVMMFLAVSGLLFVSAMVAIGGQQAHTEFNTSVGEVNAKFQLWVDQVVNGFTSSNATSLPSDVNCAVGGDGRPQLSQVASGTSKKRGANDECIFLGKAIQITDSSASDNNKIYAYSIIGRRTLSTATNDVVSNIYDAQPAAAADVSNPRLDLTETFLIPNGARVKWVKDSSTPANAAANNFDESSHLASFYNSFNTGTSTLQNGSQYLLSIQYPFFNNSDPRSDDIVKCIKFLSPCSFTPSSPTDPRLTNPWPLNEWLICLESTRNGDTAALSIVSSAGKGAATKVTKPCPGS